MDFIQHLETKRRGLQHEQKQLTFLWGLLFVGVMIACFIIVGILNRTTKDSFRIGATYMTMNNPFYSVIDEELQLMIESQGDTLLTRDPALSQEKQNEQIHDLLEEGIDILVVNPVDYRQIQPALQEAKTKHVPVVVVDSQISEPDLAACTIVSDNYGAGVLCAEHLMHTRDFAQIILLEHPQAQSAVDRIQGFRDTLQGHEDYTIIGEVDSQGQLEIAMPGVSALLEQHKTIDVVMALNDPSALGAIAALEEHQRLKQALVYGVDGAPEAKNMIKEGSMTATVAQSPIQIGQATAQVVYQILNGQEYQHEIIVPVELITADNVDQFSADGWQ